MQFCSECGGALNLFETNEEGVCWNCVRKKQKHQEVSEQTLSADIDALSGAVFSLENTMLMLKSREGWILWSGPVNQPVSFDTIIKRARHIYRVRTRRHQTEE